MSNITCPYCQQQAKYVAPGGQGYPYHRDYGPVWLCAPCDAQVGCHPDGSPLGRLANKELLYAKLEAHRVFDPLWKNWHVAYPNLRVGSSKVRQGMRFRAHLWLSQQMGVPLENTHIADFDIEQCGMVVEIIDRLKPTAATVRQWFTDTAR